ncbi:hypothetical protein CY34DRAFT_727308 [Suillus luteus UH-Slu-Lm8-n1]|uniref:Uncharacterized protein n=1 Tax=Suillus luteus UH-Slu-Lm8-n1 TaxID=930992 RepID=A0A0D0AFX3_9AGAM|nr:hypothetical protein CY34DRAFT_727308 [Suillus luteus UH-Slu-Lm8-n1]
MSDSEEPRCFPFEQFPLPPGDKSRDARVPNATASLDPPLMEFIYPPPPPLANDSSWYAQMVADVHRNRAHVKTELELARTEAAEALADVTLAEIELQAEKDKMQDFLNRMAYVAGENFVRKMIRKVHQSMMGGDENLDEEYEEELEREDYEDSRASDEGEVHHQYAEEENFGGGNGEFDEGAQDAKDGTDGSRYVPQLRLHPILDFYLWCFRESPEPQPAYESPNSSPQGISHQQTSPDWRRGDVADSDDEYSSGEDDTPRYVTRLNPIILF